MEDWKLDEAQRCLGEVIRRVEAGAPQRIHAPDGDVVVLDADEFDRLLADSGLSEEDLRGLDDALEREPMGFVECMQKSPLAEAVRTGEFPWEWDYIKRTWVLPGDAVSA